MKYDVFIFLNELFSSFEKKIHSYCEIQVTKFTNDLFKISKILIILHVWNKINQIPFFMY